MKQKVNFPLVVTLIILLGASLLVFAYQYYWPTPEEKTETAENSVIDTSDWKTYTNTQYGFEIKYPLNFKKTTEVNPADIFFLYLGYNDTLYVGDISIHILKNKNNETITQYFTRKKAQDISDYNSGCQTCAMSDVDAEVDDCMVNKVDTIELSGKEAFVCNQMPQRATWISPIYVFYNSYIYEFRGFNNQDFPNYDEYNKILSTFKFID